MLDVGYGTQAGLELSIEIDAASDVGNVEPKAVSVEGTKRRRSSSRNRPRL